MTTRIDLAPGDHLVPLPPMGSEWVTVTHTVVSAPAALVDDLVLRLRKSANYLAKMSRAPRANPGQVGFPLKDALTTLDDLQRIVLDAQGFIPQPPERNGRFAYRIVLAVQGNFYEGMELRVQAQRNGMPDWMPEPIILQGSRERPVAQGLLLEALDRIYPESVPRAFPGTVLTLNSDIEITAGYPPATEEQNASPQS